MLSQMTWGEAALAWLMIIVCLFLMLVILLQRGRGGGLSAAFGGGGGSAAFGAKTGDVFTWITVIVAVVFLLLAVVNNFALDKSPEETRPATPGVTTAPVPEPTGDTEGTRAPIPVFPELTETEPGQAAETPQPAGETTDTDAREDEAPAPTGTDQPAPEPTGENAGGGETDSTEGGTEE